MIITPGFGLGYNTRCGRGQCTLVLVSCWSKSPILRIYVLIYLQYNVVSLNIDIGHGWVIHCTHRSSDICHQITNKHFFIRLFHIYAAQILVQYDKGQSVDNNNDQCLDQLDSCDAVEPGLTRLGPTTVTGPPPANMVFIKTEKHLKFKFMLLRCHYLIHERLVSPRR